MGKHQDNSGETNPLNDRRYQSKHHRAAHGKPAAAGDSGTRSDNGRRGNTK